MKTLGRIFLFLAAAGLTAISLPGIINGFQQIGTIGWGTQEAIIQSLGIIFSLIGSFVNIFCAFIALVCALIGKATFTLGLIAIINIVIVGLNIYFGIKNGTLVEFLDYLLMILGFILPILYFLGTLFISFGKSK